MTNHPRTARHVAVIGAGASGLVAARELLREGHSVVVFEREERIGGTWVYTPEVESDPLGLDPSRSLVHSSMYESLRTNLPREAMGFRDYPFTTREDPRRFPGHLEVLMYLKDFAKEFGIEEIVRLETEVESVSLAMSESESRWIVRSKKRGDLVGVDEFFNAVVVCNGHYSEPRVADVPGIDSWPGKQIHSHNYRTPEPFRDQVVVLIGISASSVDISRDICGLAKEVHIAARSITKEAVWKYPGYDNIWVHSSLIKSVHEDGSVIFEDGSVVFADTILHCTGYKFHFPFLETNGFVSVDDNRVGPLYKHVFPLALAPWLSFVGLPFKTLPFSMFELQSKWIANVLSSRVELPSEEKMTEDVTSFYSMLEQTDVPKRYTHDLYRRPFEYEDWLAVQCGCPVVEEWRKQMLFRIFNKYLNKSSRAESDDEDLILLAKEDFEKHLPKWCEQ